MTQVPLRICAVDELVASCELALPDTNRVNMTVKDTSISICRDGFIDALIAIIGPTPDYEVSACFTDDLGWILAEAKLRETLPMCVACMPVFMLHKNSMEAVVPLPKDCARIVVTLSALTQVPLTIHVKGQLFASCALDLPDINRVRITIHQGVFEDVSISICRNGFTDALIAIIGIRPGEIRVGFTKEFGWSRGPKCLEQILDMCLACMPVLK